MVRVIMGQTHALDGREAYAVGVEGLADLFGVDPGIDEHTLVAGTHV